MTIWDDRILEFIKQHDAGSPKSLKESGYFPISKQHISTRLQKLADHGMLTPLGNGVYTITERGEKYLNEELSTMEGEADDPIEAGAETDKTGTAESNGGG